VGTGTLGVYYTFRNTLSIEVREEVDEMEILEKERSILTDAL
jgi:hypothetical protein